MYSLIAHIGSDCGLTLHSPLCYRIRSDSFTPLFAAFESGNLETVQMLISAGADVNAVCGE
jgi:ankyrin repeat protein